MLLHKWIHKPVTRAGAGTGGDGEGEGEGERQSPLGKGDEASSVQVIFGQEARKPIGAALVGTTVLSWWKRVPRIPVPVRVRGRRVH